MSIAYTKEIAEITSLLKLHDVFLITEDAKILVIEGKIIDNLLLLGWKRGQALWSQEWWRNEAVLIHPDYGKHICTYPNMLIYPNNILGHIVEGKGVITKKLTLGKDFFFSEVDLIQYLKTIKPPISINFVGDLQHLSVDFESWTKDDSLRYFVRNVHFCLVRVRVS